MTCIPCTNYSIDPGNWPQLPNCLTDQLQFRRQPASSAIPIGSTLVSVRRPDVTSKDDLQNIRISHRRIWMRIRDPGSDKRILTKTSLRILTLYKHWLEHSSPLVLLRPRPLWSGLAAADAFANSDVCGIGGLIRTASQQCFFGSQKGLSNTISRHFRTPSKTIYRRLFLHWSYWLRSLLSLQWLARFLDTGSRFESTPSVTILVLKVAAISYLQ